jgi:nucleoside-diphosphate-sugar epimerase
MHHGCSPKQATIIRFFGAYGPYEPARKIYTRLVRRFALERKPQFTVLGDGENYIDAMYVDDAIAALLAVLDQPAAGLDTMDFGLSHRETITQLVVRAAHTFGLEPEIKYEGNSPEYIAFYIDPLPFYERYGVQPKVPLEVGLHRLAEHLRREEMHGAAI